MTKVKVLIEGYAKETSSDCWLLQNAKALRKSRQKILKLADWIIPGHGKIFLNPSKNSVIK